MSGRTTIGGLSVADLPVLDRLQLAATGFTRSVEAAAAKRAWDAPSPCEGWNAGDVVDHLVGNFANLARRCGVDVDLTGDRTADWAAARDALLKAAAQPGALDAVFDGPGGEMPLGKTLAVFVTTDTLVHTWDLAHAVGGDESLDEELCRRSYERALPADEQLRVPGLFGPKLDYGEDDPVQTKMLRFYGRPA
jgi:uncharacterized protein (TIGR03086 family)